MGFVEVLLIALGIAVGIVGMIAVRWLLLSPLGRPETENVLEELNRFGQQMRQFTNRLSDLTRSMEMRGGNLRSRNIELMQNLNEMNRLLRQLNQFFAETKPEEPAEGESWTGDFLSEDEEEKFEQLGQIRDEEIENVNWDELLERLRRETEEKEN